MQGAVLSSAVLLAGILLLTIFQETESNPLQQREESSNTVDDDIELKISKMLLIDLLTNLEQNLQARKDQIEATKRGLDFGMGRGFSGAEAAKAELGLALAKNPWGPGRKRRSIDERSFLL